MLEKSMTESSASPATHTNVHNVADDEYAVEKIVEKRTTRHNKTEYLIKWKGFDE